MKRLTVVRIALVVILLVAAIRRGEGEEDIKEGPVGKEVFGYLWVPEVTQPSIYIADRAMIQADGTVVYAPFYRPSPGAEWFLSQVAKAMRLAYAGTSPRCTAASFDRALSDWRYDWDDGKALRALTDCLPRSAAAK